VGPEEYLDRRWLRAAFDRAAPDYDRAAELQRDVADRVLERLELIRHHPRRVLDLGAGTGYGTRALRERYRRAEVYAVDIAPGMLRQAVRRSPRFFSRTHFACADARRLPLTADTFDLVFSSLTLQWCADLSAALAEIWRVCAPGGLVLFSTLGPDTLQELRDAWAEADGHPHVNRFLDLHVVGDALVASGFRDVVMDVDRITRYHADLITVMRSLKAVGAHNVSRDRARHLMTPSRLARVQARYETHRHALGLPATYEVVFAHAWKPESGLLVPFVGAPR
jgi:malonyl-CoA O-methyltransferase